MNRPRDISTSYELPSGGKGLDCYSVKEMTVDEGRACATGVFAAQEKDRGGDVLEIKGIITKSHRTNPICLWLHSFDYSQPESRMPIGIDEDPDGNHTVKLLPEEGIAICTTYFSQATLLASQVCALVMERTIRGKSIGYRELKVERMYEDDRYTGTHLLEIEMLEESFVPIPMNQAAVSSVDPDLVRSALSKTWAGKALHPSIKAALSPYANPAPVWANGFTFGEKNMPPATVTETPNRVPPQGGSGTAPTATFTPKAAAPVKTKDEEVAEDEQPEGDVEKHGSKALRTAHKAFSAAHKKCMKAMDGLDDDSDVKAELQSASDTAEDTHESLKAFHGKKYKDETPIEDEEEGAEKGKDDGDGDDGKALTPTQLEEVRRLKQKLKHQLRLKRRRDEEAA